MLECSHPLYNLENEVICGLMQSDVTGIKVAYEAGETGSSSALVELDWLFSTQTAFPANDLHVARSSNVVALLETPRPPRYLPSFRDLLAMI